METSKILISICGSRVATVWNTDNVIKLKQQLRIPGNLIGSLPRKPWQNQVMALPLMLIPEEVTLLLRKGYAVLSCEGFGSAPQTARNIELFRMLREKSHSEQIKMFVKDREENKRKRENQNRVRLQTTSKTILENTSATKDIDSEKASASTDAAKLSSHRPQSKEKLENEESHMSEQMVSVTEDDKKYYEKSTLIHIPTSFERNLSKEQVDIDTSWDFPSTMKEKMNYAVYSDLWEKGYYITSGGKFGCDYLVYQGEPTRYHSHYLVMVIPSSKKLSSLELLSYGRLGTGVKKTVVLAILNENDNFHVLYQSLSWVNMM